MSSKFWPTRYLILLACSLAVASAGCSLLSLSGAQPLRPAQPRLADAPGFRAQLLTVHVAADRKPKQPSIADLTNLGSLIRNPVAIEPLPNVVIRVRIANHSPLTVRLDPRAVALSLGQTPGAAPLVHPMIGDVVRDIPAQDHIDLALEFEGLLRRGVLPESYLVFNGALVTEHGEPVELPPLLVSDPDLPHHGLAKPERPSIAFGFRVGGGPTIELSGQRPVRPIQTYVSLYAGPRVERWSFTAVGMLGLSIGTPPDEIDTDSDPAAMLGFDARWEAVQQRRFLLTTYAGFGRYWLADEGGATVDARGARLGLDAMFMFEQKVFGWPVHLLGFGMYIQATPMLTDDGRITHIAFGFVGQVK